MQDGGDSIFGVEISFTVLLSEYSVQSVDDYVQEEPNSSKEPQYCQFVAAVGEFHHVYYL